MRTFAAVAAAAALLAGAGAAFASGLLGPPEPETRADQMSLSAACERDATNWEPGSGSFGKVALVRNQAYLQLLDPGFGFSGRGAGFIRVGGADFDDGADFRAGYKPFASVGIKDVWYGGRRSTFGVGTILLASYYPGYDDGRTLLSGATVNAKVENQWDVALGIAAQTSLGDRFSLYGGPLLVYGRAKVRREGGGISDATTYEEENPAGVFGGIALKLSRRLIVFAEAQYRSEVSGGASIAWSFD